MIQQSGYDSQPDPNTGFAWWTCRSTFEDGHRVILLETSESHVKEKHAMTTAEARRLIEEGRGQHFDPDVIDAFIAAFDDFVSIAERYRDQEVSDV